MAAGSRHLSGEGGRGDITHDKPCYNAARSPLLHWQKLTSFIVIKVAAALPSPLHKNLMSARSWDDEQ